MQADRVAEQVRSFILEHFSLASKRGIRNEDHLLGSGLVDSLGILDLVAFIEREFQFTVNDEDLVPEHFKSIQTVAAFVQGKLNGAAGGQSEE